MHNSQSGLNFTMYTQHLTSGQKDGSQSRRRSHRPRGCRGGRKNRKNREAKAAAYSAVSGTPVKQMKVIKGDLSPFQYLNTNTSCSWNTKALAESEKGQMLLPPPLPPFVGGRDPFAGDNGEDMAMGLKMLPSFEDEASTETPSSSFEDHSVCVALEQTLFGFQQGTMSTFDSSEDSDCTTESLKLQRIEKQRRQHLESGSLFVTSPRSFLLGSSGSAEHTVRVPIW